MNKKLIELAERRGRLIVQAAEQRTALTQNVEPWRIPLALADYGLAALRFIKNHSTWIAGGGILFAVLRPGQAGKWLKRGWAAWQIMKQLGGK